MNHLNGTGALTNIYGGFVVKNDNFRSFILPKIKVSFKRLDNGVCR